MSAPAPASSVTGHRLTTRRLLPGEEHPAGPGVIGVSVRGRGVACPGRWGRIDACGSSWRSSHPRRSSRTLPSYLGPRREAGPDLRWTDPHQWHLTLAFMARGTRAVLDDLDRAPRPGGPTATRRSSCASPGPAASRTSPGPGCSGAGVEDPAAALPGLARGVRGVAAKAGADPDGGRFRAHLTLARLPRPADATRWVRVLEAYAGPPWVADELTLVESHLGEGRGGRPRYEVVDTFALGRDGPPDRPAPGGPGTHPIVHLLTAPAPPGRSGTHPIVHLLTAPAPPGRSGTHPIAHLLTAPAPPGRPGRGSGGREAELLAEVGGGVLVLDAGGDRAQIIQRLHRGGRRALDEPPLDAARGRDRAVHEGPGAPGPTRRRRAPRCRQRSRW